MEHNPIQNDARQARREQRFGKDAACASCGEKQPEALTVVKRNLIELHHVVGRANDPELKVCLCLNCHAVETDNLRKSGVSMRRPQTFLERLVEMLKGLGSFFISLGERLAEYARRLAQFVAALDERFPSWREDLEA